MICIFSSQRRRHAQDSTEGQSGRSIWYFLPGYSNFGRTLVVAAFASAIARAEDDGGSEAQDFTVTAENFWGLGEVQIKDVDPSIRPLAEARNLFTWSVRAISIGEPSQWTCWH